jgi:t-SNARE complex subunit (syntaxin)
LAQESTEEEIAVDIAEVMGDQTVVAAALKSDRGMPSG